MEDWKHRLQQVREKKFPKKTDFAKLVGVSNATVTDWEKSFHDGGIKELSASSLVKIQEVLEIDLYWLLTGRGAESAHAAASSARPIHAVETPPHEAVDEVFRHATEILETYRLAGPAGRERIDVIVRDVREGLALNQAKPRAP